jgi:hypothetical protein
MMSGEVQPSFDELVDQLVSEAIAAAEDRLRNTSDEPGARANGNERDGP